MSAIIQIERFTRQNQSISGHYAPTQLVRLAEYLAGNEGEIHFSLIGGAGAGIAGSQKRCVKCIISGWFLMTDPGTLQPVRHELAIESRLVVVKDESGLPPLELESPDEDYIICGPEMNVMERIEEEILLDLPFALAMQPEATRESVRLTAKSVNAGAGTPGNTVNARASPFARLAELKKK
jgi:uncharacterized metal-binding protein YceD (DUF177 family)